MQHQIKHVGDPSQGQANLEADHRRRNFCLRSQPLLRLPGKEKENEGERTTPSSQTPNWNYLPSLREQNTTTILNTEGSPTHSLTLTCLGKRCMYRELLIQYSMSTITFVSPCFKHGNMPTDQIDINYISFGELLTTWPFSLWNLPAVCRML